MSSLKWTMWFVWCSCSEFIEFDIVVGCLCSCSECIEVDIVVCLVQFVVSALKCTHTVVGVCAVAADALKLAFTHVHSAGSNQC